MAGIDQYTKLCLHFDGSYYDSSADYYNETSSSSSSYVGKIVTAHGSYISNDYETGKFGDYAVDMGGAYGDNWLSVPADDDFNFGTGDFCVDMWLKNIGTGYEEYNSIFSLINSPDDYCNCYSEYNNGTGETIIRFGIWDGVDYFSLTSYPIDTSSYMHFAVCRDGNTGRMFINGTQQTTQDFSGSSFPSGADLMIGIDEIEGSYYTPLNGIIDEFRVSKGVPRFTENFTPPTEAYSYTAPPISIPIPTMFSRNVRPANLINPSYLVW